MKKLVVAVAALVLVSLAGVPAVYAADPSPAVSIDLSRGDMDSLGSVIAKYAGKPVIIKLKSGEELGGNVVMVKNGMVHLTRIKAREFYDAVIGLDAVAALLVLK